MNQRDKYYKTPLMIARLYGKINVAQPLLDMMSRAIVSNYVNNHVMLCTHVMVKKRRNLFLP